MASSWLLLSQVLLESGQCRSEIRLQHTVKPDLDLHFYTGRQGNLSSERSFKLNDGMIKEIGLQKFLFAENLRNGRNLGTVQTVLGQNLLH